MKLTSEQREHVDAARAAGQTSIVTPATPEQIRDRRAAAAEEDATRDETIAAMRRMQAAEAEPGFFGDLRRAVSARLVDEHRRGRPASTSPLGIDAQRLEEFREGIGSLTDDELRRLVETLGLQLVQVIPPASRQETTST